MISYKLAKKLKDAGFPQGEEGIYISSSGIVRDIAIKAMKETGQAFYSPTLSELIEACGVKLKLMGEKGDWYVSTYEMELENETIRGKTPEEAVAKLWLKLNNPDK